MEERDLNSGLPDTKPRLFLYHKELSTCCFRSNELGVRASGFVDTVVPPYKDDSPETCEMQVASMVNTVPDAFFPLSPGLDFPCMCVWVRKFFLGEKASWTISRIHSVCCVSHSGSTDPNSHWRRSQVLF